MRSGLAGSPASSLPGGGDDHTCLFHGFDKVPMNEPRLPAAQTHALPQSASAKDNLVDHRQSPSIRVPVTAQIEDPAEESAIGSAHALQLHRARAVYDLGRR